MQGNNVKREIVEEIHKPARINFKRRAVIIKSLNDLFQADLVEMIPFADENDNYKYILVVINCFSKFVWAVALKTKTGLDVSKALYSIFESTTPPDNLQTDMGTEFLNREVKKILKKYKIHHYQTYSEKKASIVERVNRTLKSIVWKEFSFRGNYKWIDYLDEAVHIYNNKKHRTIGMKPIEVNANNEQHLLQTVYNRIKRVDLKSIKFNVGDHVRISKLRQIFDKNYYPNWSTEIFTISEIKLTNPITYLLKDYQNIEIAGGFYTEQLQKVKYPDSYLVEKILRRNKNRVYVKWLGFDDSHNSWIDENNLL